MKIVTIVGARPQFIKASVVSRILRNECGTNEVLVHTGQHFDKNMSEIFFNELNIPYPNHHLGIGGGSHGQNTGRMIEAIETVLQKERPDWVLVYGDTDSTLAGALATAKLRIPLAHIEAGLRSFNREMPEELNRVLTDHAADLLFAPTKVSVTNLVNEGIIGEKVKLVGDVMYDAAIFYANRAKEKSQILATLDLEENNYVLATVHRQENTDNPNRLKAILQGLATTSLPVILPLHPRTQKRIREAGFTKFGAIKTIAPLGYLDMVMLETHATMIATDSGGVQKEAYFYKKPCAVLRDESEWIELVDSGWNRLVGANSKLIEETLALKGWKGSHVDEYGAGDASYMISRELLKTVR